MIYMTPEQQGILVTAELNLLPHLSEFLQPDKYKDPESCCPYCCGPCGVIHELDQEGKLDWIVQRAPVHYWQRHSWWHGTQVDRVWLYSVWACPDECVNGQTVYVKPSGMSRLDRAVRQIQQQFHADEQQALRMIGQRLKYETEIFGDEPGLKSDFAHAVLED